MFFGPCSYKSSLAQHQRVLSYIRSLLPVLSARRTSAAFLRPACLFSRALHTIADDHCQSPAGPHSTMRPRGRKGFVQPGDPAKLGEAIVRRMRPYWERQPAGNSTSHAPPPRCRGDPPGVASQMPKRRTLPWPTRSSRPQNDYIDRSAVHSGSNRACPQVTITVPEAWAVCEPKGGHLQTQPLHEEPSHPRIFARRFAAPREALLW